MKTVTQKRLAIMGALAALGIFIVANAQLITVAFRTQPACVAVTDAALPARHAC